MFCIVLHILWVLLYISVFASEYLFLVILFSSALGLGWSTGGFMVGVIMALFKVVTIWYQSGSPILLVQDQVPSRVRISVR